MPLVISCSADHEFKVAENRAGTTVRCPRCREQVLVPAKGEVASSDVQKSAPTKTRKKSKSSAKPLAAKSVAKSPATKAASSKASVPKTDRKPVAVVNSGQSSLTSSIDDSDDLDSEDIVSQEGRSKASRAIAPPKSRAKIVPDKKPSVAQSKISEAVEDNAKTTKPESSVKKKTPAKKTTRKKTVKAKSNRSKSAEKQSVPGNESTAASATKKPVKQKKRANEKKPAKPKTNSSAPVVAKSAEQESFDYYYKWLGITPKDQPPHHYRLLGIDPCEEDRDVIDGAANRVMLYLQELQTGQYEDEVQKLLNEISQVRQALLSPEVKSAYDAELRNRLVTLRQEKPIKRAPQPAPAEDRKPKLNEQSVIDKSVKDEASVATPPPPPSSTVDKQPSKPSPTKSEGKLRVDLPSSTDESDKVEAIVFHEDASHDDVVAAEPISPPPPPLRITTEELSKTDAKITITPPASPENIVTHEGPPPVVPKTPVETPVKKKATPPKIVAEEIAEEIVEGEVVDDKKDTANVSKPPKRKPNKSVEAETVEPTAKVAEPAKVDKKVDSEVTTKEKAKPEKSSDGAEESETESTSEDAEEKLSIRGMRHDSQHRWAAYNISIAMALLGLFSMIPGILEIVDFFQHEEFVPPARWAYAAIFFGVMQLGYAGYVAQLPDWSSIWVVAMLSLGLTTLYAVAVAICMLGNDGLLAVLQIEAASRNRAVLWCFGMLSLTSLLTYFAGRTAVRWHNAHRIALKVFGTS